MQKRNLSSRHKLILNYMNGKHSVVPGRELAERLGVSTRTVRFAVSEINDILKDDAISIDAVSGKGYILSVGDRELFHELISDRDILHTKEDRIVYLIIRLMESEGWIELADLEDDIFVSRTTLENDLREIRNRICEHNPYIVMERRKNAILLEDNEIKKRNVLLRLYSEIWDFNSREGISFRKSLVERENRIRIRAELKKVLCEYEISLDDYGMVNMEIALSLIYLRNMEGHRLHSTGLEAQNGSSRHAVDQLLSELKAFWKVELEEADHEWLADYLERLRILGLNQSDYDFAVRRAGAECVRIADQLQEDIRQTFGIEFDGDEVFRTQLLLSVRAFVNRQRSIQAQSRFSTDLLEKQYTILGDVARFMIDRLSEMTGKNYRKGEENWLLPILCSATERRERKNKDKVTVVIVSHLNDGLTRYLYDNFMKLFGMRCRVTAVLPVYNRRQLLENRPSFILSTVQEKLFEGFDIPCVVVSPIITEDEFSRIDLFVRRAERAALHEGLPAPMETYCRKGEMIDAQKKDSADALVAKAQEIWKRNGVLAADAQPDPSLLRYVALNRDNYLIYSAPEDAEETCFTKVAVNRTLQVDRPRNIRYLYIGIIGRADRKYMPAFFGELDAVT